MIPSSNIAEHLFRKDQLHMAKKSVDNKGTVQYTMNTPKPLKTQSESKLKKHKASQVTNNKQNDMDDSLFQQSVLSQMYKYISGNNSLKK